MIRWMGIWLLCLGSLKAQKPVPAAFQQALERAIAADLRQNDQQKALEITDSLVAAYSAYAGGVPDSFLALVHHNRGVFHYYHPDTTLESCIREYLKALSIRRQVFPENHLSISRTAHNLGVAFRKQYDFSQSIQYLELAEGIRKVRQDTLGLGLTLLEFAYLYDDLEDFSRSQDYGVDALRQFELKASISNLARTTLLLGTLAAARHEPRRAIALYQQSLAYNRQAGRAGGMARCHHNLGEAYHGLSDWARADSHYREALVFYQSGRRDSLNEARVYNNLGIVALGQQDTLRARRYLMQSLKIRNESASAPASDLAESHANIGDLYMSRDQPLVALSSYQRAIQYLLPDFTPAANLENPVLTEESRILGPRTYLDTLLMAKARCLIALSAREADPTSMLEKAIGLFLQADRLLTRRLRENLGDEAQLFWLRQAQSRYETALELCYRLQRPDLAFRFLENGRSRVLLASVMAAQAQQKAGVPGPILEQERMMVAGVLAARRWAQAAVPGNEAPRDSLRARRLRLNRFRRSLEKNYPSYVSFKYQDAIVRIEEVQRYLRPQKGKMSVLQYFVGRNCTYLLQISRSGAEVFRLPAVDSLLTATLSGLPLDANKPELLGSQEAYDRFLRASHALYKTLIPEELALTDRLVIIPDGLLAHLPFEVLLIREPGTRDLPPYLVMEHSCNYAFSCSILMRQVAEETKQPEAVGGLMAFAPGLFTKFAPLTHSRTEMDILKPRFPNGNLFYEEKASLGTFIREAPAHSLIHLSTHAQARRPAEPWIAFWGDSLFSLSEIYTLRSQARMVVLSACQTHMGTLEEGEGLMSLARGFHYAGIPSTVASLWQVNDAAAPRLMEVFYDELLKGNPKDVALAIAKRKMLQVELPDLPPPPYSWAPMLCIGDPAPITSETSAPWLFICVAGMAFLVMGVGAWWYQRRRPGSGEKPQVSG